MRKILMVILLIIVSVFAFSGCAKNSGNQSPSNKNVVDEFENHKKMLMVVADYDSCSTNGFDYSLEQKLNGTVVNAHTITVRLDRNNGIIGSRVEYKKSLNDDISKGQFDEISATSYYRDNKIATYENETWNWKNCSIDEFAKVNIDSFDFNIDDLKDLQLSTIGKNAILTFSMSDSVAASFLGVSNGSVKGVTFEIKTDSDFTKLMSFKMSYSQNNTTTEYSFVTYSGSVNIDIPE